MHVQIAPLLGWAATLLVCGLAWARGGPPERWGSLIVLAGAIVYPLIQLFLPASSRPGVYLLCEGLYGLSFLMLALRYTSPWLGGAMLLQAIQFSLHAYYFVTGVRRGDTYAMINNIDSAGVLLCLVVGTIVAWRKRVRAEK